MKEIKGDLWNQPDAEAICVTTNGFRRKDGACVMGRGCALEATKLYTGIAQTLGFLIEKSGNHVHAIGRHYKLNKNQFILSFPVKHNFWEKAELSLIGRSAEELSEIVCKMGFRKVVIPKMGCGCGKLYWNDVKEVVEPIFDDRFYIISYR